jgi:DNA-binding NarL/FixJ family response regulator
VCQISSTPVDVLLVDERALERASIALWLERLPGLRLVAQCGTNPQELRRLRCAPDLALVLVEPPGFAEIHAAFLVRRLWTRARLVFLSRYFHQRFMRRAAGTGAVGFISSLESPETIHAGLLRAAAGERVVSQRWIEPRRNEAEPPTGLDAPAESLTQREADVLVLTARGLSKREVAAAMGLSESTIDAHRARLARKLGLHDRVELALFAVRHGFVSV